MKTNYIWLLIVLLFGFTACDSDDALSDPLIDDTVSDPAMPNFTSGSADFSTFVAIGNSLTAGFSDNSLFAKGQAVSFPNLLSQRMALAGGGEFTQPLTSDDVGGLLLGGTPIAGPRLVFNPVTQGLEAAQGTPSTDITNIIPGPYNNMGVPGAKSFHLLANGYGNIANFPAAANPYFVRMASSPNASMLEDAMALNPTFFSLWIGNNDVLGYATSGGDGSNPITDTATFTGALTALVQTLTSGGAEGILANIPNVTDAPFFTTVPYNAVPLDAATAGVLNAGFAAYNGGLAQLQGLGLISADEVAARSVTYAAGANPVLILDETLTDLTGINPALLSMRPATPDDLLILPSSSFIGTSVGGNPQLINGVSVPLADNWVVIPSELQEIQAATATFNGIINNLAETNDLALFDVNTFFNGVASNGFPVNAFYTMTADFVTGGTFSLDGVHPSPRGYAVVTNQMIAAINAKYGSNLPEVNPVDFTGLYID